MIGDRKYTDTYIYKSDFLLSSCLFEEEEKKIES
jgi:hypothetical protein